MSNNIVASRRDKQFHGCTPQYTSQLKSMRYCEATEDDEGDGGRLIFHGLLCRVPPGPETIYHNFSNKLLYYHLPTNSSNGNEAISELYS